MVSHRRTDRWFFGGVDGDGVHCQSIAGGCFGNRSRSGPRRSKCGSHCAKIAADIQVAQKENERRIVEATTKRQAVIAEVRGQVKAQVAEARAQLKAWDARVEQMRRKLEADVVAPADAQRQLAEAKAKGKASQVIAQGRAAAAAVTALSEAFKSSGARGREALLLQKIVPVFDQLASTLREIKVDRLVVLGPALSANDSPGTLTVNSIISGGEQIRAATGVDLLAAAKARIGLAT